jgi:hypothetical protein
MAVGSYNGVSYDVFASPHGTINLGCYGATTIKTVPDVYLVTRSMNVQVEKASHALIGYAQPMA